MLIIGDAAIQQIDNNYPLETLEIIAEENNIEYVKNTLKIKDNGEKINKVTTRYYKNKKQVLIHNANNEETLKDLLLYTTSNRKVFKYLPPRFQFALQRIPIVHSYTDSSKWLHDIAGFNILRSHCLEELYDRKDIKEDLSILSSNLLIWSIKRPYIKYMSEKYPLQRTGYNEFEILRLVSENNPPKYNGVWQYNFYNINDNLFMNLKFIDKLNAVMERLYVDTLLRHIIGHPQQHVMDKDKVFEFFVNSYMTLASNYVCHKLFSTFIIENYVNIMKAYSNNFYFNYRAYIKKEE